MVRRVVLACLLVLAVQSPIAAAAPGDPRAGPEALLEAFPLDPSGKRVAATPSVEERPRSEAVPALPESDETAVGGLPAAALLLLAATAAGLVLLLAFSVGSVRRIRRSERRVRSLLLRQAGPPGPRQRILEYVEALPLEPGGYEITPLGRRYPDIPVEARVRVRELPDRRAISPPAVEWTPIDPHGADDGDTRAA